MVMCIGLVEMWFLILTMMANDKQSTLTMLCYNCRGYNVSKRGYVAELLSRCDILYLQEHWLCDDQLGCLSDICNTHYVHSICGFDNTEVLRGRPYGGCAIFWHSKMSLCVDCIDTHNNRVCAVHLYDSGNINLLLINVYMPYVSTDDAYDEFCTSLSVVAHLIESYPDALPLLGGDFNVDFARHSAHSAALDNFCNAWNLKSVLTHTTCNVDFTYNFCMQRFSILDHIFVPQYVFDSSVQSVDVSHDIDNRSDHDPLSLRLSICWMTFSSQTRKRESNRLAWHKASAYDLNSYKESLKYNLLSLSVPNAAIACQDVHCHNNEHRYQLQEYAHSIANASLIAAGKAIPLINAGKDTGGNSHRIPGWHEFVTPYRNESLFWHNLWLECGRPHSGVVADCMRRTRAAYHYAIRQVRRNRTEIIQERFAQCIINNNTRNFWTEVNKIKGCNKGGVSNVVDGLSDCNQIANLFADKYEELYSSVVYNSDEMDAIKLDVNAAVDCFSRDCVVSFNDVSEAVNCLKFGKNDGFTGLSTNHIKYGPDELCMHISLLFSSMLVHGCAPSDFLISSIVPIPKGRNGSRFESGNYRGIALSSVLGKIFDRIILNRYADVLITSDSQFGFKKGRSTAMCTMVLKETIDYYTACKGTVYCTLLDATKAFDRIHYCKLFRCLIDRKLPAVILRLLISMYINHVTRVVWNGVQSRWFGVLNGVKQGGVLSPVLFCVYMDGLLKALQASGVGCFVGSIYTGALAYADDIVLLSPTVNAARKMLRVCEEYAATYSVKFNANKSYCIVCESRSKSKACISTTDISLSINGCSIKVVDNATHLGHVISHDSDDSHDVLRCRNKLIGQINNVLCTFHQLDSVVKNQLIKSYCLSLYGCELWDLKNPHIENVCKAWRSGLKRVWGLPTSCRSTILCIISDTMPMLDLIHKRSVMFVKRCLNSNSVLVKSLAYYGVFHGRMLSGLGRNLQTCCEHFSLSKSLLLGMSPSRLSDTLSRHSTQLYSADMFSRALATIEFIMLRRQLLCITDWSFSCSDLSRCIFEVCS